MRRRKKKCLRGQRKSLKRFDPDKEIKVNSFDFLWPALLDSAAIWLDLDFSLGGGRTPIEQI
jgi:hypothetical protein